MGRFINADAFTATGQGLIGNNMFAYCNNNPVCYNDPTGYLSAAAGIGNPNAMMRGGGCYNGGIIPDDERIADELERQARNLFNTNPEAVLQAESFAFYKGSLVMKLGFMGKSGFSLGVIFIGNDASTTLLCHEYGHFAHLTQIGLANYLAKVVLPSAIGFWCDVPFNEYYSQPWEYIAEVLGEVNRIDYQYSENAHQVASFYWLFTMIP